MNFITYKLYLKKADFKNSSLSFSDRQLCIIFTSGRSIIIKNIINIY